MVERLYYHDSQLLEFAARVVASTTQDGKPAVQLDRTAFYPTSGGQPHDLGTLSEARVIDVVDAEDVVLHVLDGPVPAVGATVVGRIDGQRRRNHAQQHTGQHVLSQAFEQTGHLHTVSFHLGDESCTIDLDSAEIEPLAVDAAEELANRVVLEDRPILLHFVPPDEVTRFGLRKPTARTGVIRIVEIEGFDRSACGGTHVRRTGEIGPIKVRRWERRGETTRVEFLCGDRALRDYAWRTKATRALAERLHVRDTDVLPSVSRALDELERLRDERTAFRDLLLAAEVDELRRDARDLPGPDAGRLVLRIYIDEVLQIGTDKPADMLKRLALRLTQEPDTIALLGSTGERSHVVLAQSPGLPHDLAALLRQIGPRHGLRGGGTRDLAQGGGPGGADVAAALEEARQIIAVASSERNVQ